MAKTFQSIKQNWSLVGDLYNIKNKFCIEKKIKVKRNRLVKLTCILSTKANVLLIYKELLENDLVDKMSEENSYEKVYNFIYKGHVN